MAEKYGSWIADSVQVPQKAKAKSVPHIDDIDEDMKLSERMRRIAEWINTFEWDETDRGHVYWSDVMDELFFEAERQALKGN